MISEIPDGATLSDGTNSFTANGGNGYEVDVSSWDLTSLTITTDARHDGDFELTVQAIATESSGGKAFNTTTLSVDVGSPEVYADSVVETISTYNAISHWRMDEATNASSETAADRIGGHGGTYNYVDDTTNTPYSNITTEAADFDGASDYLRISHHNDFALANGTIQLWFDADSTSGTRTLLEKSGGLKVWIENGSLKYTVGGNTLTASGSISTNTWYHLAVTWGAAGMQIYLDGNLVGSNASYTGDLTGNSADLYVGAENGGTTGEFNGQMADLALFGEQLSESQIDALRDAGLNGNDSSIGTGGGDNLTGTAAGEVISGLAGDDTLDGGDGDNVLYGGAGNDTFDNTHSLTGSDTFYGGDGDDTAWSGDGGDVLFGGAGNDSLHGELGHDTVFGGTGHDYLSGGGGNDSLFGGAGEDSLYGGADDDTLDGGLGFDSLYGGDGSDLFIFQEGSGGDIVYGGVGGGWTDTMELQDAAGGTGIGTYGSDWTVQLTTGSITDTQADHLVLSDDAAGIITLQDGSEVTFEGIERIEW